MQPSKTRTDADHTALQHARAGTPATKPRSDAATKAKLRKVVRLAGLCESTLARTVVAAKRAGHAISLVRRFCTPMCCLALAMIVMPGCTQSLDRAESLAHQNYRAAVTSFSDTNEVFASAYENLADKKHELQATGIERDWQSWISRHTDEAGRLVSRDSDGAIKPLRAEDLEAAIALREQARDTLGESKRSNAAFVGQFRSANNKLRDLTTTLNEHADDWQKAREEAYNVKQMLLQTVGTLAGLAIGVAM